MKDESRMIIPSPSMEVVITPGWKGREGKGRMDYSTSSILGRPFTPEPEPEPEPEPSD